MKDYEIIEHTADIGIRVKGGDLKELFSNAASAMFDIIAGEPVSENAKLVRITLKLESGNLEELFVDWLNELLSLSSAKELIFSQFSINQLDENNLQAVAAGVSSRSCKVNVEIKAATYHQLKIERSNFGWQAEVIFDV